MLGRLYEGKKNYCGGLYANARALEVKNRIPWYSSLAESWGSLPQERVNFNLNKLTPVPYHPEAQGWIKYFEKLFGIEHVKSILEFGSGAGTCPKPGLCVNPAKA